jgi:homoserine dehydrogenase
MDIEIYLRYSDIEHFELFKFKEISEQLSGVGYNYVIGKINLQDLLSIKSELQNQDIFIAYFGEE